MGVEEIKYPLNLKPIVDRLKAIEDSLDIVKVDVAEIKKDVKPKIESS